MLQSLLTRLISLFFLILLILSSATMAYLSYTVDTEYQIQSSDTAKGTRFGHAVSLSDQTALIGAPGKAEGKAYFYSFGINGWTLTQEVSGHDIVGSGNQYKFGSTVKVVKNYAMISAPGDTNLPGKVYFFRNDTGTWDEKLVLNAPQGAANFGSAIVMDENWAVIGAPPAKATDTGSVYFYKKSGSAWQFHSRLVSDSLANNDRFGMALAINAGRLVIGAGGHGLHIYSFKDSIWKKDTTISKATWAANNTTYPIYGDAAAIGGNFLLAGAFHANGSRYITLWFYIGTQWVSTRWSYAQASADNMGNSVAWYDSVGIIGHYLSAGAYGTIPLQGSVSMIQWVDGGWYPSDVSPFDENARTVVEQYGYSVDINKGTIIGGAPKTKINDGRAFIHAIAKRPLSVTASNGAYTNRTKLTWQRDTDLNIRGFRIYRDGQLIDSVAPGAQAYYDYNGAPGKMHAYGVAQNEEMYGWSLPCYNLGWRPANGSIDGMVATKFNAGVENVEVQLANSKGASEASLSFDGTDDYVIRRAFSNFPKTDITLSFWLKTASTESNATMLSYAIPANKNAFSIRNPGNLVIGMNDQTLAGTNVSVNDDKWHHLAITWRNSDGELNILKDGAIVFTGSICQNDSLRANGSLVLGQKQDVWNTSFESGSAFEGSLDEVRIWNSVEEAEVIQAEMHTPLKGDEYGLVTLYTFDDINRTPTGFAADYAKNGGNHGTISGAIQETDPKLINHALITNASGSFSGSGLYYGNSSQFQVIPYLAGHRFNPVSKVVTLSTSVPALKAINFVDTTVLTVSGSIKWSLGICGVAGVDLMVNNVASGQRTDASGNFTLVISEPGSYTIKPVLGSGDSAHTFSPKEINLLLSNDTAGIRFTNQTLRKLEGNLLGVCGAFIGTGTLRITSMGSASGCVDTTLNTTAEGYYSVNLPAQKYRIEVTSISPANPVILQYFKSDSADLTFTAVRKDFVYRSAPVVHVKGWTRLGQGDYSGVPILIQRTEVPLTIEVWDKFGSDSCLVSDGKVVIFDGVSGLESKPETLSLIDGEASYTCNPDIPNILEGGAHPFQKLFQVLAIADKERTTNETWVLVTGHRARAQTFTATTPEMPFLILRDPPGDQSSCSFAKDSTFTWSTTHSWQPHVAVGGWIDWNIGAVTSLGATAGFMGNGGSWSTDFGTYAIVRSQTMVGTDHDKRKSITNRFTFSETFSTSDNDQIVGKDGDVFVGASYINLYALADIINYNSTTRQVERDTSLVWEPLKVKSTFSYTESHIRDVLLPQLQELLVLSRSTSQTAKAVECENSIRTWNAVLHRNDSLKEAAAFEKNLSFSAGAAYTSSTVTETSDYDSYDWSIYVESETAVGLGIVMFGTPYETGIRIEAGFKYERTDEWNTTKTTTVNYTLSDDDPGDFFSVDVKKDPVFGTPVFSTVGGRSSCPWEDKTQPRDGVQMTVNSSVQNNIPHNETAPFILQLGNLSESSETREYWLSPIQQSNLDGAIIRVGGVVIENHIPYTLPAGAQQTATVSVERGPLAYDYENLKLRLYSPCDEEAAADTVTFSVHYISPCSRVNMLLPENNWIVNSESRDSIQIMLNDYDLRNLQLEELSFQYRRASQGWVTALIFPRQSLKADFVSSYWNIGALPDGEYELRAVAKCASSGVTYSPVVSGLIERRAFTALGTPEPIDGILNMGEAISVEFTGTIDPASVDTGKTVKLFNASDSTLIPVTAAIFENKLTLTTVSALSTYEGRILTAQVSDIRNANGNLLNKPIVWSFRVSQNPVFWTVANAEKTVYQGIKDSIVSILHNSGATTKTYTLSRVPAWLKATPTSGSLVSQGNQSVVFKVDSLLNTGNYHDTVKVTTADGTEPLFVNLTVLAKPPVWSFEPARFTNSMSITAQIAFDDEISQDPYDRICAVVGNEIRGIANVTYVPAVDKYLAYLTVYSNATSGEKLSFRLWDASKGWEFSCRNSGLTFEANGALGTTQTPVLIQSDGTIQSIPLKSGWNWISLNVENPNSTVRTVLQDLTPANGDLIKGQAGFAQYYSLTGWQGPLTSLENGKSYMIRLTNAGTLRHTGSPIHNGVTSISVKPGWNWIAYYPQEIQTLSMALASFTPATGDRIKSQTQFSDYTTTLGWQGSLDKLTPGQGYLLKTSGSGSLTYPLLAKSGAGATWSCNPEDYEFSMTVTAAFRLSDSSALDTSFQVAAFVGTECRGIGNVKYIDALNSYVAFLMVLSNRSQGDTISFDLGTPNSVYHITEKLIFQNDSIVGSVSAPQILTAKAIGIENVAQIPACTYVAQNCPNPFNPVTTIRYGLAQQTRVELSVYNTTGKKLATLVSRTQAAGRYQAEFNTGSLNLPSGIYFLSFKAGKYSKRIKMVLLR